MIGCNKLKYFFWNNSINNHTNKTMASFHSKTFKKHDDYMTPISAWNSINHFLPEGKVVWEPFFGDGSSGKNLMKLGHRVIHQKKDFFGAAPAEAELIVTNPPYSIVKDIMPRLSDLDLPFVLLMPASKLNTQYIREWKEKGLQIIIPRKRIQFIKCSVNKFGCVEPHKVQENKCNFDCFYYCYKMNLPQDIIWLDDDGKGALDVKKVKQIKLLPPSDSEDEEVCCECKTDEDVEQCMGCDKYLCVDCDPNEMATYDVRDNPTTMCTTCGEADPEPEYFYVTASGDCVPIGE